MATSSHSKNRTLSLFQSEKTPASKIPPLKPPLLDFLGIATPSEIKWAHKVNTLSSLEKSLDSVSKGKIHCLEGDIHLKEGKPVMTHDFPSQEEKYLSLKKWIKRALSCRVGLKLDFKVRQAVEPSLSILKELSVNPERVILHADILKGPGGENPKFKPSEFLSRCREFSSKSLLSLGFTTVPDSSPFTTKMVKVALGLALRFPPATICLRLEKVTEKIVKMLQKEGVFVTFWSGQDDHLTIKGWKKAVLQIRQCKPFAFLDLPGFPKCLRQEISCPKRN